MVSNNVKNLEFKLSTEGEKRKNLSTRRKQLEVFLVIFSAY